MKKVLTAAGMLIAAGMIFPMICPINAASGGVTHSLPAYGSAHHPVVQQLVDLADTNSAFRAEMQAALAEQEPTSYWYGKTLDDMYTFLDEWVVFLPTIDTARLYMDRFYEFADSGKGQQLASHDPLRSWLYQFMLAVAEFNDSTASAAAVPWWTSDPRINIADYIIPPAGYHSFNEFFTRQIKPGARTIDSPDNLSILTSPADSSIMKIADRLTSSTTINVKGENLNIRELLGNDPLADDFINGKAVLCMLNTTDYHRFHAPVPGQIVSQHQLAGLYYGMDGGWVEYFFQHRRGYIIFDTAKFGHVAMVCVGMFTISSVNFITGEGDNVAKGDELGHFAYGGSAIILLFEPGRVSFSVPRTSVPVHVNMGTALATALHPVPSATTGTNLGNVTFTTSAGSIQGLATVNSADIRCTSSGYYFPYGLFKYNLVDLIPGQQARVTIKFPNPLPLGTKYYKCINNSLLDCSTLVTRADEYTLILNLTDGGSGDADGLANGTIVDPGGPAFPLSTLQSSSAQMPVTAPQKPVPLSNIAIQSASLSADRVAPGTPITVTAVIANTGTGNGAGNIKVYVNGQEDAGQGVSVNSGGTSTITFEVSRSDPGTYTVYVGGTNAGSFTVDQFTPDAILFISEALVFFSFILGVIWIKKRKVQG